MVLGKLKEALNEVETQRSSLNSQLLALHEVETQLRSMIAKLAGAEKEWTNVSLGEGHAPTLVRMSEVNRDKFDNIADILRAEGKPLHITIIAERLSAFADNNIDRTMIEPGINRHIAKVKHPRIAKFGPSTYGLPEWKPTPKQETIAETA